jgi:pSer/pThr/pTyr-binding forkhead associated (FHA) protein
MSATQIEITTILNGRVTQRLALAKDRIVIGRSAESDVRIDHAGVSRSHAAITTKAGAVTIEDLHSSNGTLLNGKPTRAAALHNGDVVQVGSFSLHVAFADPSDSAHPSRALQKSEEQTVAMPTKPPAPCSSPAMTPSATI